MPILPPSLTPSFLRASIGSVICLPARDFGHFHADVFLNYFNILLTF
jgi:hypothetical protein